MPQRDVTSPWPALPYEEWRETCATLHLWLQIIGKIRVVQCPWVNHSWHVALRVTATGLTTGLIPCEAGSLQIDFDFVDHRLLMRVTGADAVSLPLEPQTTAAFYRKVMDALQSLGVRITIHTTPNELPDPVIPFDKDEVHRAYDAEYAHRYWRVLVQAERVFEEFRARFIGKCSPVHFFWGSADLAVTRFSGRTAPEHPGEFPTCLIGWLVKRTRTKSAAPGSGRAARNTRTRFSIRTRIPSPLALRRPTCTPRRRTTAMY